VLARDTGRGLALHRRGVLGDAECRRWVAGAYAARADWTPCFDGVQFTLGRAYYTHLEEGRPDDYFAAACASDARVERALPGLQARARAILSELVGEPVAPRAGWCGPGVHVFPAGAWLSRHGGDVHFDTEGLSDEQRAARAPALSLILMLQPPLHGGGLRVWDVLYAGDDGDGSLPPAAERAGSVTIDYAPGDMVVIDSYRLHQIQPFDGPRDRLSLTAHAVWDGDRWVSWF
jgi:hypothetical protein